MRAKLLEKELGIRTAEDMLWHFPFRYVDRTKLYTIREIIEQGEQLTLVQFKGRVTGVSYAGEGRKRRFSVFVSDATGSCELIWFQGIKWIEKRIEVGREYMLFGRPSFFRHELSVVHPELETMEQSLSRRKESGMQGIYPSTEKITSMFGAKGLYPLQCALWPLVKDNIREYLPEWMLTKYGLISLKEALYNIHFPQSSERLRAAQYRLKFDELLGIQLGVQSRRTTRLKRMDGFLFPKVGELFNSFYNTKLPFPLTDAQKRVIHEIRKDMVTGGGR